MFAIFKKTVLFVLPIPFLYLAGIVLMCMVRYGDTSLMKIASRNPVKPAEFGFTYPRLKEVENTTDVDIVFLGSSHCYRTFDTRFYQQYGLKAFNLGTTGQTPLNGYYLLKRNFDILKPRWVIMELYYDVMDRDGLESLYDISLNADFFPEMLEMSLAVRSPHALNDVIGRMVSDRLGLTPEYQQAEMDGEAYVPGGFVRFTHPPDPGMFEHLNDTSVAVAKTWEPLEKQLDYIEKTIRYVIAKGSRVLLITKPSPPRVRYLLSNPDTPPRYFRAIADKYGVEYIDFNRELKYTGEYFYDTEYLNTSGVKTFNLTLIDSLAVRDRRPTETRYGSDAIKKPPTHQINN